jgi:hypothetical protein
MGFSTLFSLPSIMELRQINRFRIGFWIAATADTVKHVAMAVLLIDDDLGALFWLGQALDRAGYEAFPAKSVPDALALLGEFRIIVTGVILNCSLPGAANLIATLRQLYQHLKVISLASDEYAPAMPGVNAICCKPAEISEQSRADWMQTVRAVLSTYLETVGAPERLQ